MYKPWEREDTVTWIAHVTNRLSDMDYYKQEAVKWCNENDVVSETIITKCIIATCIWVSHMRCEPISFGEIYDFLGIPTEVAIDVNNTANFDDTLEYKSGDIALEEILTEILKDGV